MKISHAHLMALTLFLFGGGSGCSKAGVNNPHYKRGLEWMDIRDYPNARTEFNQAINEEPKNFDAYYQVARSYDLAGDWMAALTQARKLNEISGGYPKSSELIKKIKGNADNMLRQSDSVQLAGLNLLQGMADKNSVPGLKICISSPRDIVERTAEGMLRQLDEGELRPAFLQALESNDRRVKLRSAKKLWDTWQDTNGVPLLINGWGNEFVHADTAPRDPIFEDASSVYDPDRRCENAHKALAQLGFERTKNVYRYAIVSTSNVYAGAYALSISTIRAEKPKDFIPLFTHKVDAIVSSNPTVSCDQELQDSLECLGDLESTNMIPLLRKLLVNSINSSCYDFYRQLLSRVDSPDWASVQLWYAQGGWPEYGKLLLDIDRLRGSFGGSGQNPIDENSTNQTKIERFLKYLGPKNFGGARFELKFNHIRLTNPKSMWIIVDIIDTRTHQVGKANLVCRATGDPQRFWVWRNVIGFVQPHDDQK